jgi:hypothetical protein
MSYTTSEDAAASIEGSANSLRGMIWRCAFEFNLHGITCDEIEEQLGMRHQTASARIRELELSSDLIKTDRKRPTRSGRGAFVYIAHRRKAAA